MSISPPTSPARSRARSYAGTGPPEPCSNNTTARVSSTSTPIPLRAHSGARHKRDAPTTATSPSRSEFPSRTRSGSAGVTPPTEASPPARTPPVAANPHRSSAPVGGRRPGRAQSCTLTSSARCPQGPFPAWTMPRSTSSSRGTARTNPALVDEVVAHDRRFAVGPHPDRGHPAPAHLLEGEHVFLRILGKILKPANFGDVLGPPREVFIDRRRVVVVALIHRHFIAAHAVNVVRHAYGDLFDAGEHVEFREHEVGEGVDPGGVEIGRASCRESGW